MKLEIKVIKMKLKDVTQSGEYEAYASVFGNIDDDDDIVEEGAFEKTIQERVKLNGGIFPLFHMHVMSLPIGGHTLEPDGRGLKIFGSLDLEVQRAREDHSLMRKKVMTDHSFGYETILSKQDTVNDRNVRRLKEIRYLEGSPLPVGFGANAEAGVTLVKMRAGLWTPESFKDISQADAESPGTEADAESPHTDEGIEELMLSIKQRTLFMQISTDNKGGI